jgi:hypothetical protein
MCAHQTKPLFNITIFIILIQSKKKKLWCHFHDSFYVNIYCNNLLGMANVSAPVARKKATLNVDNFVLCKWQPKLLLIELSNWILYNRITSVEHYQLSQTYPTLLEGHLVIDSFTYKSLTRSKKLILPLNIRVNWDKIS